MGRTHLAAVPRCTIRDMKISFHLPGGLQADFDGDSEEFELFNRAFRAPPVLLAGAGVGAVRDVTAVRTANESDSAPEPQSKPVPAVRTGIDVHALDERLREV